MRRAGRFARHLRILAAVIREPGLRSDRLAALTGISERTLRRDLGALRRHGYAIRPGGGYRLQEALGLDSPVAGAGGRLGEVYAAQLRLLRQQVPPGLAAEVETELDVEAPAALAALIAASIERRLR